MKVSIDTKEDSHEEIKKVIKMLQNLVGDSQEIFTNQQPSEPAPEAGASPFANIFGDASNASNTPPDSSITQAESAPLAQSGEQGSSETAQSTDDLFAELFSEDEIKNMDAKKEDEEENQDSKQKGKEYRIEFY